MKSKAAQKSKLLDLNTPAGAKAFAEFAKKYVAERLVSKEAAVEALQEAGILTKSGRLSKHYR